MTEKWGELEPEASTFEERLRLSRPKQTLCCIFEPLIHKESIDHRPWYSSLTTVYLIKWLSHLYKRITQLISDTMFYTLWSNSEAGRLGLILKTTARFRVSINLKVSLTRAKTWGRERFFKEERLKLNIDDFCFYHLYIVIRLLSVQHPFCFRGGAVDGVLKISIAQGVARGCWSLELLGAC